MTAFIQKYLNQFLSDKLGLSGSSMEFHTAAGGSINDTYQLIVKNKTRFFIKINSGTKYPKLFQKENNGLEFLRNRKIFRVPSVILYDEIDNYQFLVLEWIEDGLRTERFWKKFGEQLAALHQASNPYFGLEEDNYMGALPQRNDPHNNWVEFFLRCRL
jgi:protein-ribulosamine 3-kinase